MVTKKKKVIIFSIADEKNMPYFEKMRNSLKFFHPDIPIYLLDGAELQNKLKQDSQFFYRATPLVALNLIEKYETVIKIDADSIVCGDISSLWTEKYDVAAPNNSNPREFKKYPVTVLNVHPLSYLNCGLVAMQSKEFIEHWLKLCTSPHFQYYQYREQDLMNIMIYYGMYKVTFLDSGNGFWGLASKGYWPEIQLRKTKRGNQLILPPTDDWNKNEKLIKVLHWAGGNMPNKINLNISFQEEVARWLNKITSQQNETTQVKKA